MLKGPPVGSASTVHASIRGHASLMLIAAITGLSGCGDDSSTGPSAPPTVASVQVTGPGVPLEALGSTAQYTAVAKDAQGGTIAGKTFVWSSSDPTVATIEANGLATAVGNGATMIRAQTQGVSDAIEMVVAQQAASITVSPAVESLTALGDTVRFSYQITDGNGHSVEGATATWSSTDPSIASVSNTGLATAISPGVAHVLASMGVMADTAEVTVGQSVETLVISPAADTLTALGDTVRFAAVLRDKNDNPIADATVAWSSTEPSIVSVDADGLATAVANGDAAIVATSGTVSDTAFVLVGQAVESVVVTPAADTLVALGDTVRLVAEITDSSGAVVEGRSVAWASTDPSVVTVDSEGLASAVSNGTALVVGAVGAVSDTAVLLVQQQVVSVEVSPALDTLTALGDTARLAAVALDSQGAVIENVVFTWSSSAASIAGVDQTGLVTAVSDGTALITASTAGLEGSAEATVNQLTASFDLSPSSTSLTPGDTVRLVVSNAVDANGNPVPDAQFEYTASDPTVLSVDASGLVTVAPDARPGTVGSIEVSTDAAVGSLGVTVLLRPASIGAGYFHTCSVTGAGVATCWGQGSHGQLGNGTNDVLSLLPVLVSGGHSFSALTVGGYHNCGIATDGVEYCWGDNTQGELGDGTTSRRNVPVPVIGGDSFSLIGAGNKATCGITRSGDSYCWGAYLGTDPGFSTSPLLTPGGHQFFTVDLGADHACAIEPGGAGYCWGSDTRGELGNGPTPASSVPGPVSGGHAFVSIETGSYHSCGVTTSGDALCWGRNQYGELGDGTTVDRDQPVLVSGGLSFKSVTTKARHTCGLTASGEAYCWGQNEDGRLGDGTTTERWTPVAVAGGLLFEELDVGLYHSCGRSLAGDLYCWGRNANGQLGDGTTTNRLIPTLVQQ